MCEKVTESVSHILAGCGALAQTLYLARHNNALKILFFQVIRALDQVTSEVPWFSKTQPKPMYENERAIAYWDIPLYADNMHVKANRDRRYHRGQGEQESVGDRDELPVG